MRKSRPINSCDTCRRRRLRCDKTRPKCGRCLAADSPCSYSTRLKARSSEEHTHEVNPSLVRDSPGTAPPVSTSAGPNIPDKGSLLVEGGGRSTYRASTFWGNNISANLYPETDHAHISPFPHWPANNNHPNDIDPKIGPHSRQFTISPGDSSVRCRRCGERYRLQCVFNVLPARPVCEKLIDLFFASVFTLTPILHLPTFAADHREFWKAGFSYDCLQGKAATFLESKPSFIALYFSMLFAALKSAGQLMIDDLLGDDKVPLVADLYLAATISTTLVGFPRRPSLYALAGFIFAQSQLIREEEFPDAPSFIETAFRVALGMGLHRDSSNFGLPDAEGEMRRRLWWHVIHLDVMASASSGLSPLWVDEMMSNTSLMSKYEDFHESGADPRVDLRYIVAIHRYRCTREIRHIIRSHFDDALQSNEQIAQVVYRLHELGLEFSNVIQSLLEPRHHLGVDEDDSTSRRLSSKNLHSVPRAFEQLWAVDAEIKHPAVAGFQSWAAVLLHLMLHKAYLVLYHPLFRHADADLRATAIKHSQVFVQLFIRMCEHPACDSFRWMYPGTYQPLQALSILLADLADSRQSDQASASRGLIDATFQLYQVDEGIVSHNDHGNRRKLSPYGREAWAMLIRTRRKALEQMGKDPHVLLPSGAFSGNDCVCGQEIGVHEQILQTQVRLTHGSSEESPPDLSPSDAAEGEQMLGMGEMGFNWDEWDSVLGNGPGILA